jgi:hypothetical protein
MHDEPIAHIARKPKSGGGGGRFRGLLLKGTGDVGVVLVHGRSNTHANSPPVGKAAQQLAPLS